MCRCCRGSQQHCLTKPDTCPLPLSALAQALVVPCADTMQCACRALTAICMESPSAKLEAMQTAGPALVQLLRSKAIALVGVCSDRRLCVLTAYTMPCRIDDGAHITLTQHPPLLTGKKRPTPCLDRREHGAQRVWRLCARCSIWTHVAGWRRCWARGSGRRCWDRCRWCRRTTGITWTCLCSSRRCAHSRGAQGRCAVDERCC